MTVVSATASTLVVSGNQTANANKTALVNIDTANYRGASVHARAAVFGGVNTTFTITDQRRSRRRSPRRRCTRAGNWAALRTAAFAYFDALGATRRPRRAAYPRTRKGARRSTRPRWRRRCSTWTACSPLSTTPPVPMGGSQKVIPLGTFAVTC